jgi:hypothetical protein
MSANLITSKELQNVILCHPMATNEDIASAVGVSERRVWANRAAMVANVTRSNKKLTLENLLSVVEKEPIEVIKPKDNKLNNVTNFNNCVIENVIINNVPEKKQGVYIEGENKKDAKLKMQNYIIATNIQGHIGTLTNTHIDMETAIYNAMPKCYFTTVERVLSVYEQMRRKFKNCGIPIKCIKGEFSSILYGKNKDTYAHLIMDYCGDLPKVGKEFEYTITNNLVGVGGIIALTTTRINRRGSGEMWDFITSLSNDKTINKDKDNRSNTEIQNERFLYGVLGRNYEIIETFNYNDGYPMTLTIIKRIK